MDEDSMIRKATRPIKKDRRTRSKPAKIRHLQKQQKLWIVSKMKWRKPGAKPGHAPSSLLRHTFLILHCGFETPTLWSCCVA